MQVKDLKAYKASLETSLNRDLSEFEKNFILITSGILAFSITFIKDIVKIGEATNIFLLFVGWTLIFISTALMMFIFLYSVDYCNTLWKSVDDFLLDNRLFTDDAIIEESMVLTIKNKINDTYFKAKKKLRGFRYTAVGVFAVGFFSFAIFVGINIFNENDKPKPAKKNNELIIKYNNEQLKYSDTIIISNSKNK